MFRETGSKKSTQIGQFFAEGGRGLGREFLSLLGEWVGMESDGGTLTIVCSDVVSGWRGVVCILNGRCELRFTLSCENSAHTCNSYMSPYMCYSSVHALENSRCPNSGVPRYMSVFPVPPLSPLSGRAPLLGLLYHQKGQSGGQREWGWRDLLEKVLNGSEKTGVGRRRKSMRALQW